QKVGPNLRDTVDFIGLNESKITDLSSSCVSDGVVLIDPEQVKGKKVYVMLSCTFRYGRDDMDVLGMAFRRDIFLSSRQVYPPLQDKERSIHTKVQEKILRKLGDNAYPFFFEFPDNLPCSVCLHPGPTDVGKHVDIISIYIGIFCKAAVKTQTRVLRPKLKIQTPALYTMSFCRSSVRLAIRKIQYALDKGGAAPSAETTCEFIMSDKPLPITTMNKHTDHTINKDTVPSGTSLKKVYTLCPLLDNNRERLGLALDGKLKHEDTNLASSMLKEILGMLVAYRVVVKCNAAG
uniref:S-arrestin n=1 Tax=Sinocyclocheilus anshuiensis TaxID=1608454 RepID=A0A671MR11_9TELE